MFGAPGAVDGGIKSGIESILQTCSICVIMHARPRVGLRFTSKWQQGGDAMLDFSFSELYQFLLTALGMILSFLAGRITKSKSDNEK